ncbi:MAG: hypothetical protein SPE37_00780 [Campylobacter sp.]|nr:hypothetical protein [Campylobacter sp.]
MRLLRFARNDENSRIPYRYPPVKLGDDIVRLICLRNSRILKSRIPSLF